MGSSRWKRPLVQEFQSPQEHGETQAKFSSCQVDTPFRQGRSLIRKSLSEHSSLMMSATAVDLFRMAHKGESSGLIQ